MKKTISKEVSFCDQCGKETYVAACQCCGVDHCWECRKEYGTEYTHAVCVSGSGDGYYCKMCDRKLSNSGSDPLHNAYSEIASLRKESNLWNSDFRIRSTHAEEFLKRLRA